MRKLEEYINVGTKRLRCGYTTGTCSAAAARAAAELLVRGERVPAVSVGTPAGIEVIVEIEEHEAGEGWAQCAVRKDSGDDPDVTNGTLVYAKVEVCDEPGIRIDGGLGVGRVTKPGLDQPVGEAAINHVPREMIARQVEEVLRDAASSDVPGVLVTISIPAGVELAAKTFNPRLGIEGGISVLGTSGIVKPMSEDALISSIELELRMLRESGVEHVLLAPGNYGRDYARDELELSIENHVQCSNYIGAAIDACVQLEFSSVLVVGHIGKMAKVAAGNMNTHSRVSDARRETIAAHAAMCGADRELVAELMDSITTDDCLEKLQSAGLFESTMASLMQRVDFQLKHRVAQACDIEALVFSNVFGTLGTTAGAERLMGYHGKTSSQGYVSG